MAIRLNSPEACAHEYTLIGVYWGSDRGSNFALYEGTAGWAINCLLDAANHVPSGFSSDQMRPVLYCPKCLDEKHITVSEALVILKEQDVQARFEKQS